MKQPVAALMIDVQLGSIAAMEADDARGYLDSLARTLGDLRAGGVPVHWVTIAGGTQLYDVAAEQAGNIDVRPRAALEQMHFYKAGIENGSPEDAHNFAVYDAFISAHGPRRNEIVFCKDDFSAFDTSFDQSGNPGTLTDYLKARATERLFIMGTTAQMCCLATAIGAVRKGFAQVAIVQDRVGGWPDAGYEAAQGPRMVWGGDGAWHQNAIIAAANNRNIYSDADRQAFAKVKLVDARDMVPAPGAPGQDMRGDIKPVAQI